MESTSDGRISLVAFFVMIIAFLSLFVGTVSRIAEELVLVVPFLNLLIASLLFVFGIGFYLIEIVFLVADDRQRQAETA